MDILFLVARVLFGGYFILNGYNHIVNTNSLVGYAASKKVPNAKLAVFFTGLLILLGGLGILFWVYVPTAVLLLSIFLLPVTIVMHNFWTETDPARRAGEYIAFTKNMALLGGALAFLFI